VLYHYLKKRVNRLSGPTRHNISSRKLSRQMRNTAILPCEIITGYIILRARLERQFTRILHTFIRLLVTPASYCAIIAN